MLLQSSIDIGRNGLADRASRQDDRIRIPRREHVFHEGDDAEALYQIASGAVALYRMSTEGTRIIQGVRFAGESIGFARRGTYGASALAVQPCLLVRLVRERAGTGSDGRCVADFAAAEEAELARLSDQIMVLSSRSAVGSLAATILDFSERGAGGSPVVILPLRRAELADLLALTVETVSRAMTRLKMRGAIEFLRPDIVRIRDRSLLHELAEGDGEGAARGRCAL